MFTEHVVWSKHSSKHSTALAHFILTNLRGGRYERPFLQRSKLRPREVKNLPKKVH